MLVMCETYQKDGTPHPTNYRHSCAKVSSSTGGDSGEVEGGGGGGGGRWGVS